MTDTIETYLTKIQIGAEQSFKNLSIFPLLSDCSIPFDYLTIEDAISKDLVEMVDIKQNGSTHIDNRYHRRDRFKASRDYLEHFAAPERGGFDYNPRLGKEVVKLGPE